MLSTFAEEKIHPYLLSSKHRLATLILQEEHKRLLHVGLQLLLANVLDQFWIVFARNLARKIDALNVSVITQQCIHH